LPETVQPAAALDEALHRPAGWLERHAGIRQRRVWAEQDPLTAAAEAGREALASAGVLPEEVGALLVASEAPPQLLGLAAALHHRLGLRPEAAALEVGGACTGFLAAVRLAQGLLGRLGAVVVLAVEAPSRFLTVQPGPAGEAAALFGDAAAAAVLTGQTTRTGAVAMTEVLLGADGSAADLLRAEPAAPGCLQLLMEGQALASRAVRAMADLVREAAGRHGRAVAELAGLVAHGGNGRMPGLVARQLGLPAERVWSATPDAGNLGAAALPVAWALLEPKPRGPVVWTAAGAGLTWAAAYSFR
jgi:3-oxoacyl-[acyl-carrier-protein] synthase-3